MTVLPPLQFADEAVLSDEQLAAILRRQQDRPKLLSSDPMIVHVLAEAMQQRETPAELLDEIKRTNGYWNALHGYTSAATRIMLQMDWARAYRDAICGPPWQNCANCGERIKAQPQEIKYGVSLPDIPAVWVHVEEAPKSETTGYCIATPVDPPTPLPPMIDDLMTLADAYQKTRRELTKERQTIAMMQICIDEHDKFAEDARKERRRLRERIAELQAAAAAAGRAS